MAPFRRRATNELKSLHGEKFISCTQCRLKKFQLENACLVPKIFFSPFFRSINNRTKLFFVGMVFTVPNALAVVLIIMRCAIEHD